MTGVITTACVLSSPTKAMIKQPQMFHFVTTPRRAEQCTHMVPYYISTHVVLRTEPRGWVVHRSLGYSRGSSTAASLIPTAEANSASTLRACSMCVHVVKSLHVTCRPIHSPYIAWKSLEIPRRAFCVSWELEIFVDEIEDVHNGKGQTENERMDGMAHA